jgi:hypothetical protein
MTPTNAFAAASAVGAAGAAVGAAGAVVGAAGAVVGAAGAAVGCAPPQAASTIENRTIRLTIVKRFMEFLLPLER